MHAKKKKISAGIVHRLWFKAEAVHVSPCVRAHGKGSDGSTKSFGLPAKNSRSPEMSRLCPHRRAWIASLSDPACLNCLLHAHTFLFHTHITYPLFFGRGRAVTQTYSCWPFFACTCSGGQDLTVLSSPPAREREAVQLFSRAQSTAHTSDMFISTYRTAAFKMQ